MIKRKKVEKKEKTKKFDYRAVATKYPPLTSEEQYKRTRKEQNALNRSRSKAMENKVAKVLGGRRVLLSGAAAAYKGDVEVPLKNYPGNYIVECKLSAQNKEKDPYISIQFAWFPKMHIEAKSMGSKFAVLVINFLGNRRDYVFIRKDIVEKIINRYHSPYSETLSRLLTETIVLTWTHSKAGKPLNSYTAMKSTLEDSMSNIDGMEGVRVIVPDGEYLVLHLDTFATVTTHM